MTLRLITRKFDQTRVGGWIRDLCRVTRVKKAAALRWMCIRRCIRRADVSMYMAVPQLLFASVLSRLSYKPLLYFVHCRLTMRPTDSEVLTRLSAALRKLIRYQFPGILPAYITNFSNEVLSWLVFNPTRLKQKGLAGLLSEN